MNEEQQNTQPQDQKDTPPSTDTGTQPVNTQGE